MAAAEFSSDVFEGLNGERRGRRPAVPWGGRGGGQRTEEAVAPIRHLVGGKDNRRVESSHLAGRRRRGERGGKTFADKGRTQQKRKGAGGEGRKACQ